MKPALDQAKTSPARTPEAADWTPEAADWTPEAAARTPEAAARSPATAGRCNFPPSLPGNEGRGLGRRPGREPVKPDSGRGNPKRARSRRRSPAAGRDSCQRRQGLHHERHKHPKGGHPLAGCPAPDSDVRTRAWLRGPVGVRSSLVTSCCNPGGESWLPECLP